MDLAQMEAFFFKAMQAGYAGGTGTPKVKVADMPGYKEIRYKDGGWLLIDRWCVNPDSEKSAGTTTIWYQVKPVWFMSYGGIYPQAYITFLKMALRQQYTSRKFNGGRGPERLYEGASGVIYQNRPEQNEFGQFKGREEILSTAAMRGGHSIELAGYHEYWGMSLI